MEGTVCRLEKTMDQDRAELVAGLSSGDPDLLERLIEQYQHRLFRYLLSLTGHRATAEDVFQETWLRVLERGGQYRGRWKFESWLFGIARHLVIDLARRKKAGSLDQLMHPGEGKPQFEPETADPSPFDQLQAGEEAERVLQALARMAPVYREVLVLRFQEELSLNEIAEITEAPLSTVKSRLYRGLDLLRGRLERGSR